MFTWIFWILAIWFVINFVWTWFVRDNRTYPKTFAWINVVATIIGFWVYFGVSHDPSTLATCFLWLNWINVVWTIIQFFMGYENPNRNHKVSY